MREIAESANTVAEATLIPSTPSQRIQAGF